MSPGNYLNNLIYLPIYLIQIEIYLLFCFSLSVGYVSKFSWKDWLPHPGTLTPVAFIGLNGVS